VTDFDFACGMVIRTQLTRVALRKPRSLYQRIGALYEGIRDLTDFPRVANVVGVTEPSRQDLNAGRISAMSRSAMSRIQSDQIQSDANQAEDDIFFDKVPDEAIERAAETWSAGAFTIGNCTGLGSCPA
jgi:hypothetical protein